MKPYAEVAVSFATALADGDFERARSHLIPELQSAFSAVRLRDSLFAMFEGYATGAPTGILHDEQFDLDVWPDKQPGDVGSTYVSIVGDDFVEAVSIVVAHLDGALRIRSIEWGRP